MGQESILNTEYLPASGLVAIIGKTGAGKSNLIRHFLQEFPPTDLLVFNSTEKICPEYSTSRHVFTEFSLEKYNKLATGRHGTRAVVIVDAPITNKTISYFRNAEINGVLVVIVVQSENSIPKVLCDLIKLRFYAGKFSNREMKTIYENLSVFIGQKSFAKTLSSVVKTPHQFFITNSLGPVGEFFKYTAPKCDLEITMDEIHNVQDDEAVLEQPEHETKLVIEEQPEKEDLGFVLVENYKKNESKKGACSIM